MQFQTCTYSTINELIFPWDRCWNVSHDDQRWITLRSEAFSNAGSCISQFVSIITRGAPWDPDRRRWLFSAVRGGIWTPSPVLIKISADKRPLNHLTVKNLFFSLFIKTFCHQHQCIVHEKAINLSAWMKEICILLPKLYIICSRMQRVNLHARPSIIQVGCTTCSYQVCALDHAKWGTADLGYHSEPCRRNVAIIYKQCKLRREDTSHSLGQDPRFKHMLIVDKIYAIKRRAWFNADDDDTDIIEPIYMT